VLQAALGHAVNCLRLAQRRFSARNSGDRVLALMVYAATPRDRVVLAACVLAMTFVGLVATWVPAQRALAIDPMVLLREE